MNSKPETPDSKAANGQLIRGLGLTAAIAVNVANIIGTGVFLKARVMTCNVGTPGIALDDSFHEADLDVEVALFFARQLSFAVGFVQHGNFQTCAGRCRGRRSVCPRSTCTGSSEPSTGCAELFVLEFPSAERNRSFSAR